jgi:hypothetical protein
MSRRAALPGANELFRTTSSTLDDGSGAGPQPPEAAASATATQEVPEQQRDGRPTGHITRPTRLRRVRGGATPPSGRERHEEKITVYLSAEELMALEDARVTLYREHGVKVDRGRIVREAIALVMADLEAKAGNAILVRQLTDAS